MALWLNLIGLRIWLTFEVCRGSTRTEMARRMAALRHENTNEYATDRVGPGATPSRAHRSDEPEPDRYRGVRDGAHGAGVHLGRAGRGSMHLAAFHRCRAPLSEWHGRSDRRRRQFSGGSQ